MKKIFVNVFLMYLLTFSLFSQDYFNQNNKVLKQIDIKDSKYSFYLEKKEYSQNSFYKIVKECNGAFEYTTIYGNEFSISAVAPDEVNIFSFMDHNEPLFIKKSNFFENYHDSNIYKQLESKRIQKTGTFIEDIDNDGSVEIISLGYPYTGSNPSGIIIYKYFNDEWHEVLAECYFGWEEFYNDKNFTKEEWYLPKRFPYDFVEYKGKTGLRIVCYDQPKDDPTHYHAEFWAYDENAQKYVMIEEIWEEESFTPPDGLIFVEARSDIFTK